jgi:hypothetical protein
MEVRDTEKLNEQKQENSKKSSILFLNLVLGSEILFILYGSSSRDSSRQHCPPWASWPLRISHTLIELTAQCFFFCTRKYLGQWLTTPSTHRKHKPDMSTPYHDI